MEEQSVLEIIRTLYHDHIRATEDYFAALSLGESLGRAFSGRGAYSGTGLLMPFLAALEETVRAAADRPVPAEEAAEVLRFMLVKEHVSPEHPVTIELEAAEQRGDPLIPLLEKPAAGQLADDYRSRYKKHRMLPSQRRTLKALEKAAR